MQSKRKSNKSKTNEVKKNDISLLFFVPRNATTAWHAVLSFTCLISSMQFPIAYEEIVACFTPRATMFGT